MLFLSKQQNIILMIYDFKNYGNRKFIQLQNGDSGIGFADGYKKCTCSVHGLNQVHDTEIR